MVLSNVLENIWPRSIFTVGFTCRESSAYLQAPLELASGVWAFVRLDQRCYAQGGFRGFWPVQLVDLHGSEQCQGLASSSSPLFIIPSLQAINHQLQVEEDGAVESKFFFSFHVLPGRTPALRGFREGVCASEWLQWRDLLFSPQRLSNQYLISPVFLSAKKVPQRKKAHRLHRACFHDSHHWRRERRRGEGRKTMGEEKVAEKREGAIAGASAIKTPEEGGDLRVIALLSTPHSRAIYSRWVQAD